MVSPLPRKLTLLVSLILVWSSHAYYISHRHISQPLSPRMFNHSGLKPVYQAQPTSVEDSNVSLTLKLRSNLKAMASLPNFVVYSDRWTSNIGPPPVSDIKGYNVCALAFLLVKGAYDKAQEWTTMSPTQRDSVKARYRAEGIKLVVSAFGATDAPTTNGADPIATANSMAEFVIQYDLDGIDVDYEDFQAINKGDGTGEAWIIDFTKQLRTRLTEGEYIITHAPVAPWFSPGRFGGGAYLTVHKEVGHLIDWYNIQFYNQGSREYTTCEGLIFKSSPSWPESSVFEIARNGVPLHKIVVGKPGNKEDASNGYMPANLLATCLKQGNSHGWRGGAMTWEYPDANSTWIRQVRQQAFRSDEGNTGPKE